MARSLLIALIAVTALAAAQAHICLLNPVQRGGYNVSTPGNMACFHPVAPCGTGPSGTPQITLQGGQGFDFLFQQNLNHYNPGFPGFLDIAYHTFPAPQGTDDGFTTIATVPDYWAHLQAQQTNFSVPAVVPNIDCDHCVLRVRYHPNKPTEPIFHNCADIRIVKTADPTHMIEGNVFAIAGSSSSQRIMRNQLVQINDAGVVSDVPTPGSMSDVLLPEGIVTALASTQSIYFIGNPAVSFVADKPASTLYTYHMTSGWGAPVDLSFSAIQFDAIFPSAHPAYPLMALTRIQNGSEGFKYQLRGLSFAGSLSEPIAETDDQETFVNFMWATTSGDMVHFLAGDENSLTVLRATIFSINVTSGEVHSVLQDTSMYTLSGLHADPKTGRLYSVSPGLFYSDHAYTLVEVNPMTGDVKPVSTTPMVPGGIFKMFYGGGVYGTSMTPSGGLLHVFQRVIDGTSVIAEIDLASGMMRGAPTLLTGINGATDVKSPVYVGPMQ